MHEHKPKFWQFIWSNSTINYKYMTRHLYECKECGKPIRTKENQKAQLIINLILNYVPSLFLFVMGAFFGTIVRNNEWSIILILLLYFLFTIGINMVFYFLRHFELTEETEKDDSLSQWF